MNSYHFARLEERILLDGSVAAVAAPATHEAATSTDTSHSQATERVLVIPADTPQLSAFVNNTMDNVKVVVFDSKTTSLAGLQQQIVDALDGQQAISIAFLNRGNASTFALSSTTVISESTLMNQPELQQFWASIGSDLDSQGQIDILASGSISQNTLFGIQTLSNAHVSESSTLSESEFNGANVPSEYFNANIIAHQDQLLGLLESTAISTDTGTTISSSDTTASSDLIHFSINLTPDTLTALMPTFAASSAWNYTMTPNQDGSLNILLTLNNDTSHLTSSDITAATGFLTSNASDTSSDGTTSTSDGSTVISGTVLHINLSITKEAFTVIENALTAAQADISFQVDQNGNATVVLKNPNDLTNMGPAAFIAKEISLLNSSLSANHESLQFTLFNISTDLNSGAVTLSQNGAINFFSINSFADYLGQIASSNQIDAAKAAAAHDAAHPNSFDHTVADQNGAGIVLTTTTQAGVYNENSNGQLNTDHQHTHAIMNEAIVASTLSLTSILKGADTSTSLAKHPDNFAGRLNQGLRDSSSTVISEQHLPNQRFGEQPFYPENQKSLNLTTLPPQDPAMKSVIGALSWAEFKLDGKYNTIPKESSLIQDFPIKTSELGTDATLFSNKSVTNLRFGKGQLGLND